MREQPGLLEVQGRFEPVLVLMDESRPRSNKGTQVER
jgi:hypothetical protein